MKKFYIALGYLALCAQVAGAQDYFSGNTYYDRDGKAFYYTEDGKAFYYPSAVSPEKIVGKEDTKPTTDVFLDSLYTLITNIRTMYIADDSDYSGPDTKVAERIGVIPEFLEGKVSINVTKRMPQNDNKAFIIGMRDVPQEICVELAKQDFASNSGSSYIKTENMSFFWDIPMKRAESAEEYCTCPDNKCDVELKITE